MPDVYDTLKIEHNKCPPDCRLCEEACAKEKDEGVIGLSRIKTIHTPQVDFHGAMTCIQCAEPRCQSICPAGAIDKGRPDGVVRIDESRCVGCGLCTLACPYGGIYFDQARQLPFKCDRCNGEPKCAEACPYQVITYIKNRPVLNYLAEEDFISSGTRPCTGCLAELALRFTTRVIGRNTILFGAPGCANFPSGFDTRARIRLPFFTCLLTNVASTMTGVYRYYRNIGRDNINLVAFVGDGATVDIGFQPLSAAVERQENFIYICNDNEGYMATGVQRSGSTPFGAQTTTTPVGEMSHGKAENSKYLPLIMLFHRAPYVATATMAYPEDYAQKLAKAMKVKDGVAYIHLFTPCVTGWKIDEDKGLDVSRLAVETNYFPLWEAEHGKVRLTHEVTRPRHIKEYCDLSGRYSHLTAKELEQVQELVNERYYMIKALASMAKSQG